MMTEQIALNESVSTQNEVVYEPLFPSIDSPSSIDSGVGGSPLSSTPGSPSFSDDIDTSKPEESSTAPAEKTIKKLLELLVAAKTAGERSLLSNILTTLVSTSLKKDNVPSTRLSPKTNVVEHHPSGKRPAGPSPYETPAKIPKTSPASVKPSIFMVEQPEQNYRARYESEGCRGPVHGSSELTFPTFQIKGYNSPLWVTVYLATSNGTPHFHLLCGPGSTKLPCRDTTLPDGVAAIQVLVGPETEMTAVLDCISLKRRRNFEADKELRRRGLNPADWKAERKEACFVMTAEIPGHPSHTITCKSKVFQCTAPPGHPEIWWMRPVQGYATGGEEIGIIGKKFLKGFQVKFFGELPSGEMWQAYGEIDKSKTNTGACVVKSPPLKDPITSPFTVNVEISGDHASNYTSSDSVTFTYLPVEKPSDQENLELIRILNEIAGLSPESTSVLDLGIDALSQEWEEILHSIDQLYQTGCITEHQNRELRLLVSQHDTILLEAFRTTKQTVADSEFLSVFCQYLAGLNVPQCTN